MVDKDMSEINALNDVFPESDALLCWYHAVVRWLMKSDSGVSRPQHSSIRKEIIDYFKKMKACPMWQKKILKEFSHYKELCNYFQRYWEPIRHRWADYGRCYNHDNSETNNLIER
uniref:MULE transposase domain-containing protein n=1 Tax=Cyprinus carpio TaxID=7962 RepID=A0A8C2CFP9_CYPCA